jgi:hypothetical protein
MMSLKHICPLWIFDAAQYRGDTSTGGAECALRLTKKARPSTAPFVSAYRVDSFPALPNHP